MTVFDDLAAEQDRLDHMLAGLEESRWTSPSGAAGWTIADVVLHLAQSEESVVVTTSGRDLRAGLGIGSFAMSIDIQALRDVTDEDVGAINRLLPQLSGSAPPLDREAVRRIATWQGNSLLAARSAGDIIGILTLVMFPIPTGLRARIEDVVVDEAARGQGTGAALTREAIRLAQAAGARTIDLTTRPSRDAASRLYERLGFGLRDTRVYRLAGGGDDRRGRGSQDR